MKNDNIRPSIKVVKSVPDAPEGLAEPRLANRIGIAKGKFAMPDEHSYPRNPEWETMPDVGLEAWPQHDEAIDIAAQATAQTEALQRHEVPALDSDRLVEKISSSVQEE